MANRAPRRLREEVARRAAHRCEYCLVPLTFATEPFAVEHVMPRARGGATALGNLALSCAGCNGHKYDKVVAADPATDEEVPLYNPRVDRWDDHFGWDADYLHLIGLSPPGRATISALHLNRQGVVNLRRALLKLGLHPRQETAGPDG